MQDGRCKAGFAFASGMAAVYSTMAALLKSGDHIVSSSSVFGATHSSMNYFPNGISRLPISTSTNQKRLKV
jgi:O-acetylhomoserine/O-acetylserine sulfhydrylase-like pyridoxal-dependent enzyme